MFIDPVLLFQTCTVIYLNLDLHELFLRYLETYFLPNALVQKQMHGQSTTNN